MPCCQHSMWSSNAGVKTIQQYRYKVAQWRDDHVTCAAVCIKNAE